MFLLAILEEVYLQHYLLEQFQLGGIQFCVSIRNKVFIACDLAIEALTESTPDVENLCIFVNAPLIFT